jgi:hypothetical protein
VVIGDNLALQVVGCGEVIIGATSFGDVPDVPSVGPNLLSIYHIAHTNKRVKLWPKRWVAKDTNDDFKVVSFG